MSYWKKDSNKDMVENSVKYNALYRLTDCDYVALRIEFMSKKRNIEICNYVYEEDIPNFTLGGFEI